MTEKRFYTDGQYVMQDGEVYVICNGEHSADVVATALNELSEENKELKKELESFEQVSFTDLCDGSRTVLYMKKENVGDVE